MVNEVVTRPLGPRSTKDAKGQGEVDPRREVVSRVAHYVDEAHGDEGEEETDGIPGWEVVKEDGVAAIEEGPVKQELCSLCMDWEELKTER